MRPVPVKTQLKTPSGDHNQLEIPQTESASTEDLIILNRTGQRVGVEGPLYPDWESQHSGSSTSEEKNPHRDQWSNKLDFIMSCISMSVGLGNVWRFPFTALENGGGAFLIPYFIFLAFIGKPICVVDMSIGQFTNKGPVGIWDMVPILRGVGYATLLVAGITVTYYFAILAFCVVYLWEGLQASLPWSHCNTSLYVKRKFIENLTCYYDQETETYVMNESTTKFYKSNAELYFQYSVAKQYESIDDGIGLPDPALAISLVIVWFLLFLTMVQGTKSNGKTAYFTALYPYSVLFILLARAVSMDGALTGIAYLFKPDWHALLKFKVWKNALSQAFFSLAVGYGTIIYGSYNPFRQSLFSEALIVGAMDGLTSLIAGVTVFAVLGVLSERKGVPMEQLAQGDMGLAFITYPEAITYFGSHPWPQMFSFIFFAMLLALGVGSGAGYFHPLSASLFDHYPALSKNKCYKALATFGLCALGFCFGLLYMTPGGIFLIHLVDEFSTGILVYLVVTCELIGFFWIYGVHNYLKDMEFMLHYKACKLVKVWCFAVPIFMLAVAASTIAEFEVPYIHVNHEPSYFPPEALKFGWLLAGFGISIIPLGALFVFLTRRTRSCYKRIQACFCPNPKWGPSDPETRKEWEAYKKSFQVREPYSRTLYQVTLGRVVHRRSKSKAEKETETLTEEKVIDRTEVIATGEFTESQMSISGQEITEIRLPHTHPQQRQRKSDEPSK